MAGTLEGQVALVTGAGRGFGRAVAQRLADEGAAVTVMARSRDQLNEVVAAITKRGGRAHAIAGDVTDRAEVERAVRQTEAAFGPLTLLVSNAGVPGPFGPIWTVDPEEWWRSEAVHIKAPMLFMHAALPGMVERKQGRVIVVSAIAARLVAPHLSAYCTGKIAQTRLVEEAAAETKDHGISVFAIDPGFVFTSLADETMRSPEAQRWLPHMVERLEKASQAADSQADLARCAQRCVDLASGRYDGLSGRYMELADDLDAMLKGAPPHWRKDNPAQQPSPEMQ